MDECNEIIPLLDNEFSDNEIIPLLENKFSKSCSNDNIYKCPICLSDTISTNVLSDLNFNRFTSLLLKNDEDIKKYNFVCNPQCNHLIHLECLLSFIHNILDRKQKVYERNLSNQIANKTLLTYPTIDFSLACPFCRVDLISENKFITEITNQYMSIYIDNVIKNIENNEIHYLDKSDNNLVSLNTTERNERFWIKDLCCYLGTGLLICCYCCFIPSI